MESLLKLILDARKNHPQAFLAVIGGIILWLALLPWVPLSILLGVTGVVVLVVAFRREIVELFKDSE